MEGVAGGGGQADGFHVHDGQEEAQTGADCEGGERTARARFLAHGQEFHQLGPEASPLGAGFGGFRLAVELFPKRLQPDSNQSTPENDSQPPGEAGGMRGGGGVGQEVTGAEEEGDPGGGAEKVAESVGPGMGAVGSEEQADDEDLRADEDAEAEGGADRQGVEHGE